MSFRHIGQQILLKPTYKLFHTLQRWAKKSGPVLLSKSQAGPGRKFTPSLYIICQSKWLCIFLHIQWVLNRGWWLGSENCMSLNCIDCLSYMSPPLPKGNASLYLWVCALNLRLEFALRMPFTVACKSLLLPVPPSLPFTLLVTLLGWRQRYSRTWRASNIWPCRSGQSSLRNVNARNADFFSREMCSVGNGLHYALVCKIVSNGHIPPLPSEHT